MVRRAIFVTALMAGMLTSLAAIADGPLVGSIEARKVVMQETGREIFLPADKASPRDIIEYRLTYANNGEEALRNVRVTDPIPTGVEYVSSSATRPHTGGVEFSIDEGKTYKPWPIRFKQIRDGKEVWVEATQDMITHIRWTLGSELEPDTEITFTYRAIVK